jgi:DNA invertase Pin-like site-specific DNA recombinase
MAKIGYIRISTDDGSQKTDRQEIIMKDFGVEKLFTDKVSGRTLERKGLTDLINYVRDDDVLYIESISRISRSTKDFLNIVSVLEDKGVQLVSHKENIDTSTPQGRFMVQIFAALSELEVETTKQRRQGGIRARKEKLGSKAYPGRKPKEYDPELWEATYKRWKLKEITAKTAMELMDMTANRFYRTVKKYESKRTPSK